jgi:hypothetical protein
VSNLVGKTFGRLTVKRKLREDVYECACECGHKVEAWRGCLQNVLIDCGCHSRLSKTYGFHCRYFLSRKGKHKCKCSPEYWSWKNARERCQIPTLPVFQFYGELGVKFCARWSEENGIGFANFLADMGPRPAGMTLDRKNPFGDYEPENCKWSDAVEQGWNKRQSYVQDKHGDPVLADDGESLIRKSEYEDLNAAIGF